MARSEFQCNQNGKILKYGKFYLNKKTSFLYGQEKLDKKKIEKKKK
jgi:hypothetical protein